MAGTSQATLETFPVILHIYDVSHFNPLLRVYSGFYRSAIEVHGVEYMFLDYIDDSGRETARLLNLNPSKYTTINKGLKLYQSIVVGRTHRSNDEAEQGVLELALNNAYNHMNNNSHHFARRVLELLVGNTSGFQSLQWVGRCDLCENQYGFLKIKVRENMLEADDLSTATFPVVLNVYKVPSGTMRRCFGFKLNFYRSSVEVHGIEYMFCEHGVAGITMMNHGHMPNMKGLEFVKSIVMGRTELEDAAKVNEVVERVGRAGGYGGCPRSVYNYISKNCHHFSGDLCNALVGKGIPGWIKRAAFYERNYTGEALTASEKRSGRNPTRDRWLVRMLNYMNTKDEHLL